MRSAKCNSLYVLLVAVAAAVALEAHGFQSEDSDSAVSPSVALAADSQSEPTARIDATSQAPPAEPRIGAVVPISGEISDVTTESLERRVALARGGGAEVIVFEIDTPGGLVTAALDICDFIKNLTDVHTVAWVHTQAISAGSMISMACDEIVMSPASSIGDCGVLMGTPMGAQAVPDELRAKAESPVLAQFRDSANRFGYPKLLCEALVVKERVVWWLENTDTGHREFVETGVKELRVGPGLDPATQPATDQPPEWKLVKSYADPITGRNVEVSQPLVDEFELLTMSQSEAIVYGFAKGIVSGEPDLRGRYNLTGELARFDFTWSEVLVRYMTSMPVRVFLLVIILLGAYVEFHTPGVGVPGLVALIALVIFVGAPYLTGLAGAWELIFIALGVLLLLLELFVIPGFGIAGIAGVVLILIGMFWSFIPSEPGPWRVIPQLPATWEAMKSAAMAMMIAVVLSAVAMWYVAKWLPETTLGRQLVLSGEVARDQTLDAGTTAIETAAVDVADRGVTLSVLRPAGKARLRGEVRDVVTQGEMIDQGAEIEVVSVSGNRIVVRLLDRGPDGLA
jgi:membrane-bound serine protease (ClpP class)